MAAPVYVDNTSLLVSTPKGMVRIKVPFKVMVVLQVEDYNTGDVLTVLLVGFTKKDNLLYYIGKRYYSYWYFEVKIK